jgi:hypothetical protein
MTVVQKDLFTRVAEIDGAWANMRPNKSFFGLTLEGFREKAKVFLEARKELAALDEQSRTRHRSVTRLLRNCCSWCRA